jgi:hypothetical protein
MQLVKLEDEPAKYRPIAAKLTSSTRVIAVTGAGISVSSGIPVAQINRRYQVGYQ